MDIPPSSSARLPPPQPYARAGRRDCEWQWATVKMPNVHPYARPASKQRRALSANLTDDTRQLNVRALIHSEMLPRANTNGAWSLSILLVDRWWPRDFIASPRCQSLQPRSAEQSRITECIFHRTRRRVLLLPRH